MESGGDLLLNDFGCLLPSVHKRDPGINQGQQLRRIQAPETLLSDLQQFPNQGGGGLHSFEPLARRRPQSDRGEGRLHHVRRAQMPPVLLRELIERDQALPVRV